MSGAKSHVENLERKLHGLSITAAETSGMCYCQWAEQRSLYGIPEITSVHDYLGLLWRQWDAVRKSPASRTSMARENIVLLKLLTKVADIDFPKLPVSSDKWHAVAETYYGVAQMLSRVAHAALEVSYAAAELLESEVKE